MYKRYMLTLSQLGGSDLAPMNVGNKMVSDLALKTAYEETVNWSINQALYHDARQVVKEVMNKYEVPTRLQALFMAYGEKVLANFLLDNKGEPLPNIEWDYVRKISLYMADIGNNIPMGYLVYKGHRLLISTILKKITLAIGELVHIDRSKMGGYLSPNSLHVT